MAQRANSKLITSFCRRLDRPHAGSVFASNKATQNNGKPKAYRLIQADNFGKIRSNDLRRVSRLGENAHHTENPRVGGSIPPLATILFNDLCRFKDSLKTPLREFCVSLTDAQPPQNH